jgi:hypothetical protein
MNCRLSILSLVERATPALILASLFLLVPRSLMAAEPPRIDFIEWFPRFPDMVTVHFTVTPNRTYTLQYLDRIGPNAVLTNSSTWGTWSNLATVRFPPDHYVIADTRTNSPQRFYRLRVTP